MTDPPGLQRHEPAPSVALIRQEHL